MPFGASIAQNILEYFFYSNIINKDYMMDVEHVV